MKLQVGQRYIRRDGTVTPPLVRFNKSMFRDVETTYLFTNDEDNGNQVISYRVDPKDLVREYYSDEHWEGMSSVAERDYLC